MAATLFYLVRQPAALRKATVEVRSAFVEIEEIRHSPQLTGCTYLRACIDEAMRLSPSVPGLLPREVLPGGITIDGETLPAGTVVGTAAYVLHHNPAYFADPFDYMPERWSPAGGGGEDNIALAASAFCPFSIGPRGCIGKGLAYAEMTTALARVLFLYDIRRAVGVADPGEGHENLGWGRHRPSEFQLVDTLTTSKDGAMVEFRKRA